MEGQGRFGQHPFYFSRRVHPSTSQTPQLAIGLALPLVLNESIAPFRFLLSSWSNYLTIKLPHLLSNPSAVSSMPPNPSTEEEVPKAVRIEQAYDRWKEKGGKESRRKMLRTNPHTQSASVSAPFVSIGVIGKRLPGSYLASRPGTEVVGVLGEPCCATCSTGVEPSLLRPPVSPRVPPPRSAPGARASSQSFGIACSTAASALLFPWLKDTACADSCASLA